MWIKFCGITRLEDAQYALELGADAIGFVFANSPRQIFVEQAQKIALKIHGIKTVGVFVNDRLENVKAIQKACNLDFVQLHGEEPPEYCSQFGASCIKAFRIGKISDLEKIQLYPNALKVLLDAFVPNQRGGTGKTIDREVLKNIAEPNRTILAGGLTPNNIDSILSTIKPFGVDVSSGIEKNPGIKDKQKMKNLIDKIKRYK